MYFDQSNVMSRANVTSAYFDQNGVSYNIMYCVNVVSVYFGENGVTYNVKMSSMCIFMRTACRFSIANIASVYFDENGVPYNVLCKYCQRVFWLEWLAV